MYAWERTLALVAGLAQLGDHAVGGVRYDGAHNTGNVAGGKGDAELSGLAVLGALLGEDVCVEEIDHVLKEEELGLQKYTLSTAIRKKIYTIKNSSMQMLNTTISSRS